MFLQPENAIETLRAMIAGTPDLSGAEIVIRKVSGLNVKVRQEDIETYEAFESLGLSLRFARRGRVSHSYTSSLAMDQVKEAVVRAMSALDQASEDPEGEIPVMLHPGDPSSLVTVDDNFSQVPKDEKINRALNLEANVLKVDPRVTKVFSAGYSERSRRDWMWTLGSNKILHQNKSWASIFASAVAEENGKQSRGSDSAQELQFFDLDWAGVARNSASEALKTLGGTPVPTGKYPVIFTQRAAIALLEVIANAFLGERVANQESFLKDVLGREVFSPLLTIYDDPHQKKKIGYTLWDDEGTPTRRLNLLTAGRVEHFAHTRRSAKKLKAEPTGNAQRSSEKEPPRGGYHNLILEPGRKDFIDLLRDMNRGLVIHETKGLHSANIVTGDFSCGATGTWVENGEEQRAVSQIALGGNFKELLKCLVGIGRDLKFQGNVASPSVFFEQISVAGS